MAVGYLKGFGLRVDILWARETSSDKQIARAVFIMLGASIN